MCSVTYSMSVSLDGRIVGTDGAVDWMLPDEQVSRSFTDEIREVGIQSEDDGRMPMLLWETTDRGSPPATPELDAVLAERSASAAHA